MTTPKLLLADDSVTIRKVVELTFVDEGIDVFAVADGDAAMLKFVEVQPDIVLVDVEMPGPTGYQICEMIKQDEATSHIPVLLLVGSFEPFDQDEAERVGADGFLTKPFHSIRELVARVWDLLGTGDPPAEVGPETEDIEDLYTSSFAETLSIQDYDTEEDLFQDAGMNAALMQADSPGVVGNESEVDPLGNLGSDEVLVEADPHAGVANGNEEDLFGDAGLDDEMIETVHLDHPADENGAEEFVAALEAPEPLAEPEPQPVKDFDWSPAAKIVDEPLPEKVPEPAETGFEPRFVFADADTVEGFSFSHEDGNTGMTVDEADAEPSEELVALIAKRVVEKLSDHIIREIAQEAVPRIAEKLIREALEEENKG